MQLAKKLIMIFLKKICIPFLAISQKMNEFTSKLISRKKYLISSLFADDDDNAYNIFKIHEFRVCDCYLHWILQFQF